MTTAPDTLGAVLLPGLRGGASGGQWQGLRCLPALGRDHRELTSERHLKVIRDLASSPVGSTLSPTGEGSKEFFLVEIPRPRRGEGRSSS
jgi:hypothetical protein